jgi:hypothetical protein
MAKIISQNGEEENQRLKPCNYMSDKTILT